MTKWAIFYDDGSIFTDADGAPEDAPGMGVVCIADRATQVTNHKWDWYYWNAEREEWWGGDLHGLLYQLCTFPKRVRAVKQGAMVASAEYERCMALAFEARSA